jgi:hypothetical protein
LIASHALLRLQKAKTLTKKTSSAAGPLASPSGKGAGAAKPKATPTSIRTGAAAAKKPSKVRRCDLASM